MCVQGPLEEQRTWTQIVTWHLCLLIQNVSLVLIRAKHSFLVVVFLNSTEHKMIPHLSRVKNINTKDWKILYYGNKHLRIPHASYDDPPTCRQ